MKVPRKLKRLIRFSFGGLYSAGILYWITRSWLKRPGEFGGTEPHPLERVAGPLHLALALFFLVTFGIVWSQHIGPALRRAQQRVTGWALVALLTAQSLTGITILYGTEGLIRFAETVHPYVGAAMLPTLAWHWIRKPGLE
jgi:hypothetical protein